MNKKVFTLILSVLFLVLGINSRAESVSIDISDGSYPDFSKWYYFSFTSGEIVGSSDFTLENLNGAGIGTEVPNAEWAARTDWDIAFHATDIRTNGAKAVLVSDVAASLAETYAALTAAPTEGYEADAVVSGTFIQSVSTMPPPRATQMSVCKATNGWATYGMGGSSTKPMVVAFELADGTYAKLYLKNFFDADNNPGHIDMEYEKFSNPDEPYVIDVNEGAYPDYSKWYYFSFTSGKIVGSSNFTLENLNGAGIGTEVPNAEWAARTDWDIAFHATDIRTNGAKAVLVSDVAASLDDTYAALTTAPADGYEADQVISGTFIQSLSSMPPPRATQMSACKVTNGWATYGMGGSSVKPMVVVFKLTNEKYVKVYLKNFYDENEVPGFITMEYAEISAPGGSTGIDSNIKDRFSIYPNPATDILNVELVNPATIVIYNLSGVVVKQVRANAGVNPIVISNLGAGTYIIKAGNQVQKFMVK